MNIYEYHSIIPAARCDMKTDVIRLMQQLKFS